MMNASIENDLAAKEYMVLKLKEVNTDCRNKDVHHIQIPGDHPNQMKGISCEIPLYRYRENRREYEGEIIQ